jgi:three-Cys-motif partner protein
MAKNKNSPAALEGYGGREHAYIKHKLLEGYLEKLFLIVGMSSNKLGITELCYVDCFAGPWSDESEEISGTSISVSMRILDKCQQELARRGVRVRFRALYVEKNKTAFARLQKHVSERTATGIDASALQGDFVSLRQDILNWCGPGAFAFFFIDPTGWKEVSINVLTPLLQRPRSEFLINFMYDFVNRTASMPGWEEEIAGLLGESINIEGLPATQRERHMLNTYRQNLKREMGLAGKWRARSAYVRVLGPRARAPKVPSGLSDQPSAGDH